MVSFKPAVNNPNQCLWPDRFIWLDFDRSHIWTDGCVILKSGRLGWPEADGLSELKEAAFPGKWNLRWSVAGKKRIIKLLVRI